MSYGTKWAIRAAVFGLVLHLLLTSAIICIIILVAKNIGVVKSIATIAPFCVHALEFLAAVSLLRTKRMNNPFIEKCTAWLKSAKYLSPCIIIEEGILISWEFHLGIVAVVGFSYAVAVGLVTKCLRLKCAETERRTEHRSQNRNQITRLQCTSTSARETDAEYVPPDNHEAFQSTDTGRTLMGGTTGLCELSTRRAQLTLVEVHPAFGMETEYALRLQETDATDDVLNLSDENDDDDSPLPSYGDALRLLLSQSEDSSPDLDDPPPCYDDVLKNRTD